MSENPAESYLHTAVIIGSDADLLAVLPAELRRSADAYDELLAVVGKHTRAVLTEQTTDLTGALQWGDPAGFYQRLGFA
jgi:hypothetical protein